MQQHRDETAGILAGPLAPLAASTQATEEGIVPPETKCLGDSRPRLELSRYSKLLIPAVAVACCLGGVLAVGLRRAVALQVGRDGVKNVGQHIAVEWKTTKPPSTATIFCWSHAQPKSKELPLLRLQLVKRANIFACDDSVVISTKKILLGMRDGVQIWTWVNKAEETPMGTNGVAGATTDSFLNTEVFLLAWETLIFSRQLWKFDWSAKVDPDSVFLPDRLRKHVESHTGETVYFSNCGKWGGQVLLYGSLEVFSKAALELYEENLAECKALPWEGWGEDYYMQHCMDHLGVTNVPDTDQVGDDRCVAASCSDYTKVAFHDFKEPEEWYKCFQEATGR